ncbi:MAG: LytR C-terminal domain-containing protein [Micrococcales bacterium]
MAKKFSQDEFDFVTRAGGQHRAVVRFGDKLIGLAKYAVAVVLISGSGIITLNAFSKSAEMVTVDVNPVTTQVTETFNGDGLGVTIIDTTAEAGLAKKVAQNLLDAGWNVYGAANNGKATGSLVLSKTTVFYSTESSKAAATDVLKALGNYELKQSSSFIDPITVVLAKDYK